MIFVASSGGHLAEILTLDKIYNDYDYLLVTEKTDLTIKEIANLTGYSDTGNFYKAFNKYFNVSPRQLN